MSAFFQRNRVVLLHLSFWCVYLSFLLYQVSGFHQKREQDWTITAMIVASQVGFSMLFAYLNYFLLLPRLLASKNLGRYLLEFLLPFAVLVFIRVHLERYIIDGYTERINYFYSTRFIIHVTAIMFFITVFVSLIRFVVEWFEFEAQKKAVENEKLTAELNFLKAQINPHFLFNTLNNLYYLAYSQSPNTTEVIAKLSQMMRYMIYDSNHPQVLLSKEIEYMQNYISLESLRLNNEIPVKLNIEGNTEGLTIVPLIFITFLENAFKHGVSNSQPDCWVNINITVNGNECIYLVENSKIDQKSKSIGEKSGIGLQNVKRRLDLSYPGHYDLTVSDLERQYSVQLKLKLFKHELPHHRRRTVSA